MQPSQPILPIMKISVPRVKMFTHERANGAVGRFQNLEGASDNVGGINCPLVEIGLMVFKKTRVVGCPLYPLVSDITAKTDLSFECT